MLTSGRGDARRNRQAILREANAAFTGICQMVPLEEIARRTGLGRATVYRHFPDRYVLAVAVAAEHLEALRRAVTATDTERQSLRDLLRWVLSTQAAMRPLASLIRELPMIEQQRHVDALIEILTPSFRQAQRAGLIRADVEPADLALIMEMLDTAAESSRCNGDRNASMRRFIAVVLDGLFTFPFSGEESLR